MSSAARRPRQAFTRPSLTTAHHRRLQAATSSRSPLGSPRPLAAPPAIAAPALPAVASSPAPAGSVAALGRTIAALWAEHARLDELEVRTAAPAGDAELTARMRAIHNQAVALSLVAMNARGLTLADAAVQIALAAEAVNVTRACQEIEAPNDTALAAAGRGLASVALLLTGADPARLAELGSPAIVMSCLRAFPGSIAVGV